MESKIVYYDQHRAKLLPAILRERSKPLVQGFVTQLCKRKASNKENN